VADETEQSEVDLGEIAGKLKAVLASEGFSVDGGAFTDVGNLEARKDGEILSVRLTVARRPYSD
jgi:hypothetical protein